MSKYKNKYCQDHTYVKRKFSFLSRRVNLRRAVPRLVYVGQYFPATDPRSVLSTPTYPRDRRRGRDKAKKGKEEYIKSFFECSNFSPHVLAKYTYL